MSRTTALLLIFAFLSISFLGEAITTGDPVDGLIAISCILITIFFYATSEKE